MVQFILTEPFPVDPFRYFLIQCEYILFYGEVTIHTITIRNGIRNGMNSSLRDAEAKGSFRRTAELRGFSSVCKT